VPGPKKGWELNPHTSSMLTCHHLGLVTMTTAHVGLKSSAIGPVLGPYNSKRAGYN
jgi:hypothetical protein